MSQDQKIAEIWFDGHEYRVAFLILEFDDVLIEEITSAMGFEVDLEEYPVFEVAMELIADDLWEVAS